MAGCQKATRNLPEKLKLCRKERQLAKCTKVLDQHENCIVGTIGWANTRQRWRTPGLHARVSTNPAGGRHFFPLSTLSGSSPAPQPLPHIRPSLDFNSASLLILHPAHLVSSSFLPVFSSNASQEKLIRFVHRCASV